MQIPINLSHYFVKEYKTLNLLYPDLLDEHSMEFSESDIEQTISNFSREELMSIRNDSISVLRYKREWQKTYQGRKEEVGQIIKWLEGDNSREEMIKVYTAKRERYKDLIQTNGSVTFPYETNVLKQIKRKIRHNISKEITALDLTVK